MIEPRAFSPSERVAVHGDSSASVSFFSSGNILQCTGALHAYKRHEAAVRAAACTTAAFITADPSSSEAHLAPLRGNTLRVDYPDNTVYAALAIPLEFGSADFLQWTGPWQPLIQHFRFLKDASPSRYICLVKFHDSENAAAFYQAMNGKPFSSFFNQTCHLAPIEALEIKLTHADQALQIQSSFALHPSDKAELDRMELPTCPVCLERMDGAISGLATTVCQHTFHCQCLSRWEDNTCPVCRYTGLDAPAHVRWIASPAPKPSSSSATAAVTELPQPTVPQQPTCELCQAGSNLWICLLCGNVGCGRYQQGHAHEHYLLSDHLYALELETQRVWDYLGDGYVHRLIQNKQDGKIVALTLPMEPTPDLAAIDKDATADEFRTVFEADGRGTVYSSAVLFSIQLESQKDFYEKQLEETAAEHSLACQELQTKYEQLLCKSEMEWQSKLAEHVSDYTRLDKSHGSLREKFKASLQKAVELQRALEEEKLLGSGLQQQVHRLSETVEKQSQQIEDLQGQVSDLCLHFQAQSVLTGTQAQRSAQANAMQIAAHSDTSYALLDEEMRSASVSVQQPRKADTSRRSSRHKHVSSPHRRA